MLRFLVSLLLVLTIITPSFAVNPDEVLDDPVLEQRARDLSVKIRCLVCQNQSIDDSDAQLARDLRVLVREKLVEGYSDQKVLDFLVERYGEFVLLKPPFNSKTLLLWGLPLIALLGGAFIALKTFGGARRQKVAQAELSAEEKQKLSSILKD